MADEKKPAVSALDPVETGILLLFGFAILSRIIEWLENLRETALTFYGFKISSMAEAVRNGAPTVATTISYIWILLAILAFILIAIINRRMKRAETDALIKKYGLDKGSAKDKMVEVAESKTVATSSSSSSKSEAVSREGTSSSARGLSEGSRSSSSSSSVSTESSESSNVISQDTRSTSSATRAHASRETSENAADSQHSSKMVAKSVADEHLISNAESSYIADSADTPTSHSQTQSSISDSSSRADHDRIESKRRIGDFTDKQPGHPGGHSSLDSKSNAHGDIRISSSQAESNATDFESFTRARRTKAQLDDSNTKNSLISNDSSELSHSIVGPKKASYQATANDHALFDRIRAKREQTTEAIVDNGQHQDRSVRVEEQSTRVSTYSNGASVNANGANTKVDRELNEGIMVRRGQNGVDQKGTATPKQWRPSVPLSNTGENWSHGEQVPPSGPSQADHAESSRSNEREQKVVSARSARTASLRDYVGEHHVDAKVVSNQQNNIVKVFQHRGTATAINETPEAMLVESAAREAEMANKKKALEEKELELIEKSHALSSSIATIEKKLDYERERAAKASKKGGVKDFLNKAKGALKEVFFIDEEFDHVMESIDAINSAEDQFIAGKAEDLVVTSNAFSRRNKRHITTKWIDILHHASSDYESQWKIAIIEADIMLKDLLDVLFLPGNSVGEKLKAVERSDFKTLDKAWAAHKIRNRIAHEGVRFRIDKEETLRVIALYEAVFKEFYII